jgi:hypothetical protein
MNRTASMTEVWADAGWHLYQFDFTAGVSEWLPLSEVQFRHASFLDQRLPAAAAPPLSIPLEEMHHLTAGGATTTTNFIFHIGHCGSTLLSRALAACPTVLPVREPLTLRQLSTLQGELPTDEWTHYLQFALAAHSRIFRPGQTSMIKATSTCNALILPIMKLLPHRQVLLYLRLESFLAGMLGKQAPAQDLSGHASARLQEWQAISGQVLSQPANGFTETQLAVLAWLTGMARLLQAGAQNSGQDGEQNDRQCLLLDFEDFLAAPETGLGRLIDFFELSDPSQEILQAWPEISLGYSKQPDQPYSAFNRNRTLARGRLQRGEEIRQGLDWAAELIQQNPAFHACSDYF